MMNHRRRLATEDASLLLEQCRREMESAERQQHRMQLVMQSAAGVCVLIAAAHAAVPFGYLENLSDLMVGVSATVWAAGFVLAVWYLDRTPALPARGNADQELWGVWESYLAGVSEKPDWEIMLEGLWGNGGAIHSMQRDVANAVVNSNRFRRRLWGIIGISGACWATVAISELAAWTV